jgi:4-hydroxy-2-oxoheptanedioate aldolase
MDAGIMGVMMPSVIGPEDVIRLGRGGKYPPLGRRGIAPVRANDYLLGSMSQTEYVPFANEQTMILPQIETMEAVNNLDSLIHIEASMVIVGPRDLSMSMGFHDGPAHAELREMVDYIFGAVRGAGLVVGTVAGTGQEAREPYRAWRAHRAWLDKRPAEGRGRGVSRGQGPGGRGSGAEGL